jgi:hypothetical protein
LLATAVTALAAGSAVEYSRIYHRYAAYHFDSVGYRWGAVETYRNLELRGLRVALAGALTLKDPLDICLRVLIASPSLTQRYGHLVTALPFLWLFLFLLAGFAFARTGSTPLTLLACTPILAFPLVYRPHLGLADCLPEAAAAGLLGTALVCWLCAESLTRRGWAAACGLSLGLLVWQRTTCAVFAVLLFIPPAVFAFVRPRVAVRQVAAGLVVMIAPLALLGGTLCAFQGAWLYRYYARAGYGYAPPWPVLKFLYTLCTFVGLPGILLLLGAALGMCFLWPPNGRGNRDAVTAAWFVAGLPLVVAACRAQYAGFVWLWIPPLMLLPAALMGEGRGIRQSVAVAVLATTSLGAIHGAHARVANEPIRLIWLRPFFDVLIEALPARPLRIQLLINEWDLLFLNQAFFDARRREWDTGPALVSQHDSYYRGTFGSRSPEEIAQILAQSLEGREEMWVLGYCDPTDIKRTQTIKSDGPTIARPTLRLLNEHVAQSEAWQPLRRLWIRPVGCVTLYRYLPGRTWAR